MPRSKYVVPLSVLTIILTGSVVLPMPGSDGRIMHLPSICPFYHLTGLPCPGCGLTRSFVCISHGHLDEALRWHALGPFIFVITIVIWLHFFTRTVFGRPLIVVPERARSPLIWSATTILLTFGIARDILILITHHIY